MYVKISQKNSGWTIERYRINDFNNNNNWIVDFHRLGYTIREFFFVNEKVWKKTIYWQLKLKVCMSAKEKSRSKNIHNNTELHDYVFFVSVGINIFRGTNNIKQ